MSACAWRSRTQPSSRLLSMGTMDESATGSDDHRAAMADTCGGPPGGQQDLAQLRPGDVVLDVATGRGAVLIPAAWRAGPAGQVVGIDIAPGMVDYTRGSIQDQRLIHASVALMDTANLTHVLRELRRVLRPGGVVGFAFSRHGLTLGVVRRPPAHLRSARRSSANNWRTINTSSRCSRDKTGGGGLHWS